MRTADVAIIFLTPSAASGCPRRQRRAIFPLRPVDLGRDPERPGAAAGRPSAFADLPRRRPAARPLLAEVAARRTHVAAPRLRLPRRRRPTRRPGADLPTSTSPPEARNQGVAPSRCNRKSQLDAIIASVPNLALDLATARAPVTSWSRGGLHRGRTKRPAGSRAGWRISTPTTAAILRSARRRDAPCPSAPASPACVRAMAPTAGLTCAPPQRATKPAA